MATPKLSVIHKDDAAKREAAELLREFLRRAEAGELGEVLVVAISADDQDVSFGASGGLSRAEQVGYLEIMKQLVIADGEG